MFTRFPPSRLSAANWRSPGSMGTKRVPAAGGHAWAAQAAAASARRP